MDTSKMSKIELLEKCKELGFTKCKSKNKEELIELIKSKNDKNIKNEVIVVNEQPPHQPSSNVNELNYNIILC